MRRLRVLIDGLPPESATKSAIRDGMTVQEWESLPASERWGQWSHTDLLLGTVADRLGWLNWTLQAVNAEKGKAPAHPEPLARPGVGGPPAAVAQQKRQKNLQQIARLHAIRLAHGAEPTPEQVQHALNEMTGGVGGGG